MTLDALQLPAWIVAVTVGLAMLARTVLWVRQVMEPASSGNGRGEWRGKVEEILRDQQRQTREIAEMSLRQSTALAEVSKAIREHDESAAVAIAQISTVTAVTARIEKKLDALTGTR